MCPNVLSGNHFGQLLIMHWYSVIENTSKINCLYIYMITAVSNVYNLNVNLRNFVPFCYIIKHKKNYLSIVIVNFLSSLLFKSHKTCLKYSSVCAPSVSKDIIYKYM